MSFLTPRVDSLERQFIINGGLDLIQRWGLSTPANFVGASGGGYFFDRLLCQTQGSTSKDVTISLSTDIPSYTATGYRAIRSLLFTNNTSVSVANDDVYYPVEYRMEGYDYRYLHGREVTLGFWFKASLAGVYSIAFVAGVGGSRSYVTSFTYSSASTWTFVSKTITMDTVDASYDFTSGLALYVNIAMASGSDGVTSTLDQWQNGTKFMASNATHWELTAGATIQVCLIQLVRGRSLAPTSFSLYGGHIGGEISACQRYFEKSYELDTQPSTVTSVSCEIGSPRFISGPNQSLTDLFRYETMKRGGGASIIAYNPFISALNWRWLDGTGASFDFTFTVNVNGAKGFSGAANSGNFSYFYGQWTAETEL